MARPVASCFSPVILLAAAAALAPAAEADRKHPAPIEYVSWGQGSAQDQARDSSSTSVPKPNSSATRDEWRGPVTQTGSVQLPQARQKVDFVYPGAEQGDPSSTRQYASVDSTPRASLPATPTRLWPAEEAASPIDASKEPAIQALTLGTQDTVTPALAEPQPVTPKASSVTHEERGLASWYGEAFHGQPTANGEIFDMTAMTAAHKTLPLPSLVQVINEQTGKEIVVRVNDRGPFTEGRIIDLSHQAAAAIGIVEQGEAPVTVRYLGPAPALDASGVQFADAETGPAEAPSAFQEASLRVSRPDLYGDMLLGGSEPTLGIPDPGKTAPTPAPYGQVADKSSDYAPAEVAAESLPPLQSVQAQPEPQQIKPLPQPQPQMQPQQPRVVQAASSPQRTFSPGIYLQVGAFSDIGNAQGRHAQVGRQFPVKVEDVKMNGADYFRVLVGPFPTRDAAERARVQLRTNGVSESFVTLR